MLGSSPRCRQITVWVLSLISGAYGSTAAEDYPGGSAFAPTSMGAAPSLPSNFQLQAELGITAFALDSTSQSRVVNSFGSHLHTIEEVLASSYGYSMVRATGISPTTTPICARSAPEEVGASFAISFVAEGQGAVFGSHEELTEAIREAMRGVDGGISVLSSCVSFQSWTGSGGVLPKASGPDEVDSLQVQAERAGSGAAVVFLQLAAFTVSCFVLMFVVMQFSRMQQLCAGMVRQELGHTDEYAEHVEQQQRDCDPSDLEASIASSCQKGSGASQISRGGVESCATQTPQSIESDTEVSLLSSRSPDYFTEPGLQSQHAARYL